MSFTFGNTIKITLFGQSHGSEIGAVIDGIPAGFHIDENELKRFMARRSPGSGLTSSRMETDDFEIVSGLFDGVTCGAPLTGIIKNNDVIDKDYENIRYTPRPGHSDYTSYMKFGGKNDFRGGGATSGRITCALCFAGGILLQLLSKEGISISSEICEIAGNKVACKEDIESEILKAISNKDSVGGKVKCTAIGIPVGVGDPLFDGLDSEISRAVFAVPAVKGIEFGETLPYGSENNDQFFNENGKIITNTNHHGGILGGISSGMPVTFTCIVKPTPSISLCQQSVDMRNGEEKSISISGRHDPCILPRILPCIESACAIAIADTYFHNKNGANFYE